VTTEVPTYQDVVAAAEAVRGRLSAAPEVALVLGTGLGGLGAAIEPAVSVPYTEIPGFPQSTVQSHAGRLLGGTLEGHSVLAMDGRFHQYEGYTPQQIGMPIRVMAELGATTLVVSNACGGMQALWRPGDIVLLADHINLMWGNPLVGPNVDEQGPRFPDMSAVYDEELRALAREEALRAGIVLREGVYVAVTGPNLETAAEYRMLRLLGADVVGMSTVPEVIVARHVGMRVLGLSIITDACLPDALEPADVETIIATAKAAEPDLTRLVRAVLSRL
jgi:purine-nucleoside phosphorylase